MRSRSPLLPLVPLLLLTVFGETGVAQAPGPESRAFAPVVSARPARGVRPATCVGSSPESDPDPSQRNRFRNLTRRLAGGGPQLDRPRDGIPAASVALGYAVADLDGDGLPELSAFGTMPPRLRVFDAAGAVKYVVDLPAAASFGTLDDGDGYDDIVLRDDTGAIRRFELRPSPLATYSAGAPIGRFATADCDRDGLTDLLFADKSGVVRVLDSAGRTQRVVDFGAPLDQLLPVGFEEDPLGLDLVGLAGDRLMAFDDENALRFSAVCQGRSGSIAAIDADGEFPSEIVATTVEDGVTSIRIFRIDGAEIFRTDVGAKLRTSTNLRHPDRDRRILAVLPERSSQLLLIDPVDGSGSRTIDAGVEIRSFSMTDLVGDSRAEFLLITQTGGLMVLDPNGAPIGSYRPDAGRVSEVRLADVDGDDVAEIVATMDGGASVRLLDRNLRERLAIRPKNPALAGCSVQSVDLDGDGRRIFLFSKETGPKNGPRRTAIEAVDAKGRRRFERSLPGGRFRQLSGDLDADGRTEAVYWTDAGVLTAIDGIGATCWRLPCPVGFEALRTLDLDRDGAPEILTQHADGSIRLWAPPPRDRTPRAADLIRPLLRRRLPST